MLCCYMYVPNICITVSHKVLPKLFQQYYNKFAQKYLQEVWLCLPHNNLDKHVSLNFFKNFERIPLK